MNKFLILLRAAKYRAINQLLHGSETRRKWIGQFIGFGIIVVFLYIAAKMAFKYGIEKLGDSFTPLVIQFINVFMVVGMVMTIRDSMEKVMNSFYEDEDIYLLFSSPVAVYSLISYKYIQLVFLTLFSMTVWLFTPWIALGRASGASWQFYAAVIPTLTLLLMIINANVAFVFMIINRYFSSRRVMRAIKVIGIIIASLAGVGIALFGILGLDNEVKFVEFLSKINAPKSDWYPHVWVLKILTSFLHLPQVKLKPLEWIARLIGASIGTVALLVLVGGGIYYRSWELSREAEQVEHKAKKKKFIESQKSIKTRGIKTTIILKDIRTLIKDLRQVLMFVMLSVILILTIFGFLLQDKNVNDGNVVAIAVQITIYATIISNALSFSAFKNEGEFWWILQSSPVSPAKLYHAKLLLGCSVAFLYAEFWLTVATIALKIPWYLGLLEMLTVGIASLIIASINTSIGSLPWIAEIGPAKDKNNPVIKILTLILTIVFIILILAGPSVLIAFCWDGKIFESLASWARKSLAVSIVLAFYIIIFLISYFSGKRNVAKLMLAEDI